MVRLPVSTPDSSFERPEVVADYRDRSGLTACEHALFHRWVRPGADVLDLGVGAGRTAGYLAARAGRGGRYVGVDIAPSMITEARRRHGDLDLRVGDASDLSAFHDGSFDAVVFSYNGIDYLGDLDRARCLAECRRVLRPDGVLILSRHAPRAILAHRPDAARGLAGWVRAGYGTLRRVRRMMPTMAFVTGVGWIRDPAQGGLDTHHSSRRRTIVELRRHGLEPVDLQNGDLPRAPWGLRTPWWYHVARPA